MRMRNRFLNISFRKRNASIYLTLRLRFRKDKRRELSTKLKEDLLPTTERKCVSLETNIQTPNLSSYSDDPITN